MYTKLFLSLFFTTFLYAYPTISQNIKEKKIYPMGEKVYKKLCKEIEPSSYKSYEEMQTSIVNDSLCQKLSAKHLEALSLYLWDLKRTDLKEKKYPKLTVTKHEKCPVCGMFLYKYPTWVCRINYKESTYAFDGIKDMLKYYFNHKEGVEEILVQDYYSQKTIDATKAFFVLGSDVYGPMGNELIAFKDEKSAKRFMLDHHAKEILQFNAITKQRVYQLDE
jgi:nitrous oxide reductase accessory protein NosL